jgi:hypothetical protein
MTTFQDKSYWREKEFAPARFGQHFLDVKYLLKRNIQLAFLRLYFFERCNFGPQQN